MPIPAPEGGAAFDDPRCSANHRPIETPQDEAVAAAGWILFGTYQAGWGTVVVQGLSSTDGMCRPMGYQGFVFADGVFAGTISPVPMYSRTDGAGRPEGLGPGGYVQASFVRYRPGDPFCCPSGPTVYADYEIQRRDAGPVLVPTSLLPVPR